MSRVPQLPSNRHAGNQQVSAEVGLHEHTDRPPTRFSTQLPARRPNAALPAKGDGSPPGPDGPLRDRPRRRAIDRVQHVGLSDRTRADVIQIAVVGLGDDRVGGAHVFVAGKIQQPGQHRVGRARHAERTGQHDRRFELTELIDLGRAGEFAKSVSDDDRRGQLVAKWIAAVGEDCRDAGIDRVAARDRGMTDPDAGDVGDGVERTGGNGAYGDTEVSRARTRLSMQWSDE